MFEGIRASLKSRGAAQILVAERNLDNSWPSGFSRRSSSSSTSRASRPPPATSPCSSTTASGSTCPRWPRTSKKRSLNWRRQTYVQRNGNVYEYLTNEEQVIEEEIKNVDIDASEVSSQLFKYPLGDVIKTNKIRYAKNGQDFPFGFKLDDQVHGQQKELSVHFITPEYPYTADETRMHSASGKDELRVVLDPDDRVLADLRLLLKTDKYIKRKRTSSLSAIEEQILQAKATLNREREKELVQRIHAAVGKAGLSSTPPTSPPVSADALGRVTEGFQELISRTYTQLKLLGGVTYGEQQVAGAANPDSGLFDAEASSDEDRPARPRGPLGILRKTGQGEQVTMKSIVDTFQAKPYGWDLASIEVIVASLVGASKVTLTMDGNVLKRSEVATALRNTQKHGHRSSRRRRRSTSARSQASASSASTSSMSPALRRTRLSWPATAPTSSRASLTSCELQ
jgi:hypothetical protein